MSSIPLAETTMVRGTTPDAQCASATGEPAGATALRAERGDPSKLGATPGLLGGMCYGAVPPEGAPPRLAPLRTPRLGASAPCADGWLGAGVVETGHCGAVHWRHDGQWLYGQLEVDADPGDPATLVGRVEQAYLDLFETLRSTGFAHPMRLWNYLPRINAVEAGLERYRRFNVGRQQAFLKAGHAAFEGAPAACALGTPGGPLRVHVLAARQRPTPLENPRQVSAYHYPSQYGPRAPTFSRAALADAGGGRLALLISGTASIVGHETRHVGDVAAQVDETVNNLQALLDAAHARGSARFALETLTCNVYVRHAGDLEPVRAALARRLGPAAPALRDAVFLQADICRPDLLVEIEAHAIALGEVTG